MRFVLQLLTIIFAVYTVSVLLRGRKSHAGKALKKIALMVLVIAMIIAVFTPSLIDMLAHAVGVANGINLFVYLLGVSFLTFLMNDYLGQQDNRDTVIRLGRQLALLEAKSKYNKLIK